MKEKSKLEGRAEGREEGKAELLLKQLNRVSNQLTAYIDQAFPEYFKVFNKLLSKTSLAFLSSYASIGEIKRVRVSTISKVLWKASKGHHSEIEAELIKTLAKDSIGIDSESLSLAIKQSIEEIILIQKQVDQQIFCFFPLLLRK